MYFFRVLLKIFGPKWIILNKFQLLEEIVPLVKLVTIPPFPADLYLAAVHAVIAARGDNPDQLDHPEHQDAQEIQVHKALLAVQENHQLLFVNNKLHHHADHVQAVNKDHQDRPDQMDNLEHQEPQDKMAVLHQQANPGQQDHPDKTELPDNQEHQDDQEHQHKANPFYQEHQDQPVRFIFLNFNLNF